MKLKMKLLVGAVALAAAGHASAAIQTAATGNGELFLSVYDSVAQKSYTRDLGIAISNFMPTSTTTPVSGSTFAFDPAATPALAAGSVVASGYNLTFAADPLLASFMGTTGKLNSGITWGITAGNSIGIQKYLSTSANPDTSVIGTMNNGNLKQFGLQADKYLAGVNMLGTNATGVNGSSTATPADGQAYVGGGFGDTWGGYANFSSMAGVGQSQNFFLLSTVGTLATAKIGATQFNNAQWNLAADGTLTYNVAAVPEADTWAMFGVGLLAIGAIARRRMKA